jgi:uncharacterized membrane protein
MIAQASEVAMGLTGMLLVLGLIILAVLAVLMPWYVYRIASETQKTNKLLRQLIKAYGHEPEA